MPQEVGAWLSLVERLLRVQEVAGSNPVAPTIYFSPENIGFSGFSFFRVPLIWFQRMLNFHGADDIQA